MKGLVIFVVVIGILAAAWYSWFGRYTTNTAGGRFYKNDRWTGETMVVEKDGYTHLLAKSNYQVPHDTSADAKTKQAPKPNKGRAGRAKPTVSQDQHSPVE